MKILVAGGAGFIGSNFIHYILENYPSYKIVNFDKLTYAGNLDNLKEIEKFSRYKFIKGDIADFAKVEKVFKEEKPDILVNFAAESHVARSVNENAAPFVITNVLGVQTLLEAAKRYGIKKYIQISTDEVYGELDLDEERSFKEDDPFRPNVPYAASKAGGDLMCRAYWESLKVPVIVTHCTNNYGPYQLPEKLIPLFTLRASKDKYLPVHGDGHLVRDWIYVLDHCRAIDAIIQKGKPGEVYNIGSGVEKEVLEITKLILDYLKKPYSLIKFVSNRPGNDIRYSLDTEKISRELGWRPKYKFEEALPQTVEWYLGNREWVKSLEKRFGEFDRYVQIS